MIFPRKYLPIISAVRLFCCNKFEETPNEKVVNMSKSTKPYFSTIFLKLGKNFHGIKAFPYKKEQKKQDHILVYLEYSE